MLTASTQTLGYTLQHTGNDFLFLLLPLGTINAYLSEYRNLSLPVASILSWNYLCLNKLFFWICSCFATKVHFVPSHFVRLLSHSQVLDWFWNVWNVSRSDICLHCLNLKMLPSVSCCLVFIRILVYVPYVASSYSCPRVIHLFWSQTQKSEELEACGEDLFSL